MPEAGLVSLARHAMTIARTVLPRYRSTFSKHQFTQPQLLAFLSVMRYEDWTFREAHVLARRGPYNDSATLRPMIDTAHDVPR